MICGHLLFRVFSVTNIISLFLMIALTLCGRFPLNLSQTRFPLLLIFSLLFPPSLAAPSRVSSETTGVSLITPRPARSSSLMVSPFACLALTPLNKTVKSNASFGVLTISHSLYCFRLAFRLPIGLKHSTPLLIFLIGGRPKD
jgi:hypothetical protein